MPFAVPEYIKLTMEGLFDELARDRYLVGPTKHEFAVAAARYVNEINACHPFVDGNGRTQRFWLRMLADCSSHRLGEDFGMKFFDQGNFLRCERREFSLSSALG
jgi:cell filamentation protein